MPRREQPKLSPLENAVMRIVWSTGRATAGDVRAALSATQPMKDSTVRTILRRLEQKGYATHVAEGRRYSYMPQIESRYVAVDAVLGIIERFCQGSVENLLLGMVDSEIVSPKKLRELAARVDGSKRTETPDRPAKRRRT
jgi:BlaI family transcriptional regulator, penicillinase repressor